MDWWSFGKVLGIPKSQLFTIYLDGKNIKGCRRLLIETWYKLEQPTWLTVVASLFKCGMSALGWQIAAKHSEYGFILKRKEQVILNTVMHGNKPTDTPITLQMLRSTRDSSVDSKQTFPCDSEMEGAREHLQNGNQVT